MSTPLDMLKGFRMTEVPTGAHVAATKYGHGGEIDSNGRASVVRFTIDGSYASLSAVGSVTLNPGSNFDVALCACIVGEDCPPKPTHAPGIMWPWYTVTSTANPNSGSYDDWGVRMIPVYLGSSKSYSYPSYRTLCNEKGFRVWRDDTTCSTSSTEICDPQNKAPSLGGHDVANNVVRAMQQSEETGHSGWMMVWKRDMLYQFKQAEVPTGAHTMALKYGHTGNTGSGDSGTKIVFTISSGYTDLSGASYDTATGAGFSYDIAMCACIIGEDCEPKR